MTDTIIAAYDGNDGGRDALALATVLADAVPGTALAVTTAYAYRPTGHDAPDAWHKLIRDDAADRLAGAREICGDRPDTTFVVSRGTSPADGLQQLAEELDARAIVVGENHLGPLGRIAVGSVTEQTLHGAPCAVVVAPAGYAASPAPPSTIGVADDGGPESRAALAQAVALAHRTGARLRVIHVLPKEVIWYAGYGGATVLAEMRAAVREDLERTAAAIEGVAEVETLLLEGDPATELGRVAEHLDLLVIGSRNRGPLQRVMLGSVSSRLVRQAHCPLVVLPRSAVTEEHAPATDDEASATVAA
ncbi:universal stress protein [Patulibacter defluvii]|uniref:universal stress protein n=1 Tax=Patulibacter defluvii TaxID=3095358 RepID=UPI002A75682B|nr:universal stress protein [Patulibacter sp. DM4]